jgi:2-keto-4-pentenoate hydratase
MIDSDALAKELYDAAKAVRPVELLIQRYPEMTWDDARGIARATDTLRVAAGDVQVGWKLGWTSEAMRTALGINRPNWGTLWQSQVAPGLLALDRFLHPKLEPELVWRCGADLSGDITAADVDAAGGEWALGIEVVDPRFPSFAFQALDNTADNSSSAAVVMGDFSPVQPHASLDSLLVELSDGVEGRTGPGSQAMGSPGEAVAWLVRSLADEGLVLSRGEIVFTGGLTAPFDAVRGQTYSLTGPPLDGLSLRFD